MDALELLRQDHRRSEELLGRVEQAGRDPAGAAAAARELAALLADHVDLEEDLLYPAFTARAGDHAAAELTARAATQHRLLTALAGELAATPVGDPRFTAKARALAEQLRRHLDEEETRVFAAAEDAVDDEELIDLGRRLDERRRVLAAARELRDELVAAPARRARPLLLAASVAAASLLLLAGRRRRARRRRR